MTRRRSPTGRPTRRSAGIGLSVYIAEVHLPTPGLLARPPARPAFSLIRRSPIVFWLAVVVRDGPRAHRLRQLSRLLCPSLFPPRSGSPTSSHLGCCCRCAEREVQAHSPRPLDSSGLSLPSAPRALHAMANFSRNDHRGLDSLPPLSQCLSMHALLELDKFITLLLLTATLNSRFDWPRWSAKVIHAL